MSRTKRTVRMIDEDGNTHENTRAEGRGVRAERTERLVRTQRDEKRIERGERYTARRDDDGSLPLGSTVRSVA